MHLRSISMKGFKSFPHRTKLEFGTGVSVIVGPNGSGKSNITDSVLWALGEQSPLAVRGQVMKDVIFAGGHGVQGSGAAEVEVVIDNSDRRLATEFSEISIVRRLGRDGEGEYRLNGARCRLVDVIEVLSDSGLGKEMHSVVSQGKVEQIVLSRPRERRLLIEEAAGLGKHRKRRRRAQLKLERTEENLGRALDVEREARSRLRPLKRQAEAAELHERLERQTLEARYALARDSARAAREELGAAEERARSARAGRDEAQRRLGEVARRREQAEQAFAAQSRDRERLQARAYAARSAAERISMRLERVREQTHAAAERRERRVRQLELLEGELEREAAAAADPLPDERLPRPPEDAHEDGTPPATWEALQPADRIRSLEREIRRLETDREARLADEIDALEAERARAVAERERLEAIASRGSRRSGHRRPGGRAHPGRAPSRGAGGRGRPGGGRAGRCRARGASTISCGRPRRRRTARRRSPSRSTSSPATSWRSRPRSARAWPRRSSPTCRPASGCSTAPATRVGRRSSRAWPRPPSATPEKAAMPPRLLGAQRLLAQVRPAPEVAALAERLLAGVWLVDSLAALPDSFTGLAVTRSGRSLDGATGELSQAPVGGAERVLEERRRRNGLIAASAAAVADEEEARAGAVRAAEAAAEADVAREEADVALRRTTREVAEAAELVSRAEWVMARRREAPDEGPGAVRRAELLAGLRAERRMAERIDGERAERERALERLRTGIDRDAGIARDGECAGAALVGASEAVAARRDGLTAELEQHAASGEEAAAGLRACAHEEAEIQRGLMEASEAVTGAEVAAQQVRDTAAEVERDLSEIAGGLGLAPEPATEALPGEEREGLAVRIERLARRREQLGPVNPLAKQEYDEAVEHVEELEAQRSDLESALAELDGLIKETDRRIRESFEQTFEAAAKNFEDVVQHLFPGGRGRLRLVQAEQPRAVIAGEDAPNAPEPDPDEEGEQPESGVEIEVTPPGQVDQAPVAALRRREVAGGARLHVRRVPRPAVPVLHPRRGRGGARRRQHRPLPRARQALLGSRPVHRRDPPEAHDGRRRHALWREHGR